MKGGKSGGRDFVPGQSGNPAGRPPVPEDLKKARAESKERIERALHNYAFLPRGEIAALKKDIELPAIESLIVNILDRAISTGDYTRASFILDRMLGKVPEKISHSGSLHGQLVAFMNQFEEETYPGEFGELDA